MLADICVVGYLHEVVELHALADIGAAHRGTIDAGVGPDLHIVLNHDDADLRYLVILSRLLVGCEAETVCANDRTRVERDIVANLAVVIDADLRIDDAVVAQLSIVHNRHVGVDLAPIAHDNSVADIGEGSDIDILAHRGLGRDIRLVAHAHALRLHALIELEKFGHTVASILDDDHRRLDRLFDLNALIDQDDGGLGLIEIVGIFGACEERNRSRLAFFYLSEGMDDCVFIAYDASLYERCDLLCFEFHITLFCFDDVAKVIKKWRRARFDRSIFIFLRLSATRQGWRQVGARPEGHALAHYPTALIFSNSRAICSCNSFAFCAATSAKSVPLEA